jgi:adenine/guanine phosphoribosyltransferase-like PRPP-binding protein
VACCKAGGFVYALVLAARVNIPLALIRKAGKLPPPTISVIKSLLYILSLVFKDLREKRIEMDWNVVPRGALVMVMDDVLTIGRALYIVL